MPDTDRRTVRRPTRPRREDNIMRELLAFIRAAIDLGTYKLKVRLDELFADCADPFDVGAAIDGDLDDLDDLPTLDDVETFLDDVRVKTPQQIDPEHVEHYLVTVHGLKLAQWQVNLLGAYYGEQVQP